MGSRPNKPYSEQRRRRRIRLFEEQGGKCARCRGQFELPELAMERILPASIGGCRGIVNRILVCDPCRVERQR